MKKYLLISLFFAFLFSCENNELSIDADNLLIGVWIEPTYNGEVTTFKRGKALLKESSGVSFSLNGDFTERTSGWCGTPPLSFFNIEGTFNLSEGLITISTNSYPSKYAWRIISLSEKELVIKRELTEQEIDHRALMKLFNDLSELAYSSTCSNSNTWQFTAFGAKACGGPQGYLPYSNQIDTNAFLKKVEVYSQSEKEYNLKWGVISDCAIVNPPKSIECQNGYPILKY